MRVRKKKNGAVRFEAASDVITDIPKKEPFEYIVTEKVGEYDKYCLEIGCGKGSFSTEIARRNPNKGFVAMELVKDVIIFAAEKAKAAELPNLKFICSDAAVINDIFPNKTFDTIYINFCDPWPKARHAKRRLTYHDFLEKFKLILKDDGKIEFKTDNRDLFDFSLPEFEMAGYVLSDVCYDLHNSEYMKENIMTEYEKNFSQKGFAINRLVARKK
ncbi:MAG: tRNA (guanosine(46)-N7)-methyltransferase TrmB [Clostridia bacterium]|nr:tRNA (guanosine(46)-N7)-methyltransferase TrmB [Clostridia bacterium]